MLPLPVDTTIREIITGERWIIWDAVKQAISFLKKEYNELLIQTFNQKDIIKRLEESRKELKAKLANEQMRRGKAEKELDRLQHVEENWHNVNEMWGEAEDERVNTQIELANTREANELLREERQYYINECTEKDRSYAAIYEEKEKWYRQAMENAGRANDLQDLVDKITVENKVLECKSVDKEKENYVLRMAFEGKDAELNSLIEPVDKIRELLEDINYIVKGGEAS